ncbi:DUF6773 family protein [Paenibacillus macerans]|uniref:DUF6773 family protein n=1 Tax=Paenibacillus macerans TaxID=44252 RepID=UPI002E218D52|nr:hypothetical protein [Paenibacillus macerans]
MKWFDKKGTVRDERIEQLKNRIYKEIYVLIAIICSVSVLWKTFAYRGEQSVLLEVIILLASSLYYGVRSIALGIYSDEVEVYEQSGKRSYGKRTLFTGLAIGLVLALLISIRSAALYGDENTYLKYFVLVFLFSIAMYIPLFAGGLTLMHFMANKLSRRASQSDQE